MKKLLLSSVALAAMAGTTVAADLPSKKAPTVAAPVPIWTGFYAGVNIGGGWSTGNGNNIGSGVVGGVQGGYNYQFGGVSPTGLGSGFVVGFETDFQASSMATGRNDSFDHFSPRMSYYGMQLARGLPWFGTVRGRAGLIAIPSLLIYGTGGFTYGLLNQDGWYSATSTTQTGWTAGGGAEWMFMPNWSAKVEYLYSFISGGRSYNWINLGLDTNSVNNNTRWNTVRAGVNYHFNFASVPVVAKF